MRETRVTSDSMRALEAPPSSENETSDVYETPPEAQRGGLVKDDLAQLDRYLDALLNREKVTGFSLYGESFRALSRGEIDIFEHARRTESATVTPRVIVDASGKAHVAPEWRAFDPNLTREIRFQTRQIETLQRFGYQTPTDRPIPQWRGAKSGRRVVGKGRPTVSTDATFHLPPKADTGDTLGASTLAATAGKAQAPTDTEQYDAISFCIDVARAVALGRLPVDALARVLVRLKAPESVETTCFDTLSHTQRRKLRKAIAAVGTR